MKKELKTLNLNTNTGELIINGEKKEDVSEFSLNFENGKWSLHIQKYEFYKQSDHGVKE